mgnify:CR=1 FL=1
MIVGIVVIDADIGSVCWDKSNKPKPSTKLLSHENSVSGDSIVRGI